MSEMCVNSVKENVYPVSNQTGKVEVVDYVPESKPDTFEKTTVKPNDATTKVLVGTFGAVTGYKAAKGMAGKILGFIANESKEIAKDFGKNVRTMSPKVGGAIKWATITAGTLFAGILATKDTNNDGRLDVLESISNFFKPI